MTIVRRASLALLLLGALTAVGCSSTPEPRITRLPTDGSATPSPTVTMPAPSPVPSASVVPVPAPSQHDGALDCGGRPVLIAAGSPSTLVGDCPEIDVQGSDLGIDISGAKTAVLRISGDRARGMLGTVGTVTLAGNDARLQAVDIGSLTIRGDRNVLDAVGAVGGLVLQGNENTVTGVSGQTTDEGSRNTIR